jgi:hypothetical protein
MVRGLTLSVPNLVESLFSLMSKAFTACFAASA